MWILDIQQIHFIVTTCHVSPHTILGTLILWNYSLFSPNENFSCNFTFSLTILFKYSFLFCHISNILMVAWCTKTAKKIVVFYLLETHKNVENSALWLFEINAIWQIVCTERIIEDLFNLPSELFKIPIHFYTFIYFLWKARFTYGVRDRNIFHPLIHSTSGHNGHS